MQVLDRIIFFIGSLIILLLSITLIAYAIPLNLVINYIGTSLDYYTGTIEIGILGLVLLLIAFRSIWGVFKTESQAETVNHATEMGEVKISLQTIESMVIRAAQKEVKGIKEVKTNIKVSENGVIIYLRGKILADLEIPQVSEQLQKAVKENVESQAGINVKEVKVLVENITTEASRPAK
ncbi:alkaline shock response membrane anchor protein AmaP [Natranaerobius thermophilus]|uniref:Alkaline shock response membrane anchor protein AmaP n=1 Tax=Natranaerobius thermophilus (strain ATCC BAA-1301 / DSM 18059 / JW/NM-WN-LF) TaxID=457570 RepID=B2A536_NATTJ|nr:alkaline shock response membrane anchor protein AmaP [Natranaerobius thermophilus]ACB85278.1 conserved hypothetical protein [Natranaerobius thermophilus JW/NM-WN-LF]